MQAELFLSSILAEVPQPVWVVDPAGAIVYTNPAAVAALGWSDPAELRGRPSHETVHFKRPDGSPYPVAECPMLRPRQTGETVHSEDEWFVRRDGSMFPIAWWSAPITMDGGRGAVLAFTDITHRRATERAARERDVANVRADEIRAAQRRLIESTAAVRRQVSRDLHDGAQQSLVSLLIVLQLLSEDLPADSGAARLVADAAGLAKAAIGELRELTAGIYPPLLSARGLVPAVEELAARSALPVSVLGETSRLPPTTEVTVYFVVAEAITNAVKHAAASRVEVRIGTESGRLVVEVSDDGVGGVRADAGSGLLGIADRLAALDGELTVTSPPGAGTRLRAVVPLPVG